MTRRAVHKTRKGANNDITALCDDDASWSPTDRDNTNKNNLEELPDC